jgi:zinc transport system substrate-binding protein
MGSSISWAEVKVVASIKPVHSLVAKVMGDTGRPALLIDGANSPHTYALKPRDAETLQNATVIFWVGHELEAFLEKPLKALGEKAEAISLMDAHGITKLEVRQNLGFESDEHKHHEHQEADAHIWLDTANAKVIIAAIAATLSKADPANATTYKANAAKAVAELDALTDELTTITAPAKGKGFIVFHDAYQYFEQRFGLQASGAIAMQPETTPGAKIIKDIRARISDGKVTCVFAEPQFDTRLVNVVTEGTDVRSATLDPLGADIEAGPQLYNTLMKQLARNLANCLNP